MTFSPSSRFLNFSAKNLEFGEDGVELENVVVSLFLVCYSFIKLSISFKISVGTKDFD